jgi:protein involved in polysaccharide export with SLBB domain
MLAAAGLAASRLGPRRFRIARAALILAGVGSTGVAFIGQVSQADDLLAKSEAPVSLAQRSSPLPASNRNSRAALVLDAGDRIKVKIFGREDISGEYRVSEDGQIKLPPIGAFEAANRTPAQLEAAIVQGLGESLRSNLVSVTQRQELVSIEVIERRPVYVTGYILKPGAYPFAQDMVVLQALSLAGGLQSTGVLPQWLPAEALREATLARVAEAELGRLLARQARLIAQKEDREKVRLPQALVELVGAEEAALLVEREQAILDRLRGTLAKQVASLEASVAESNNEIQAYRTELSSIDAQRKVRARSLATIKDLSTRGLTTQQRLTDLEFMMSSADRDAQTAIANIARSKQNLERSKRELVLLTIDKEAQIEKELQSIDEEVAKLKARIKGSLQIVQHIGGVAAKLLTQPQNTSYRFEIVRRSRNGQTTTIRATELTPVLPGDVVRVELDQPLARF